MLLGINKDDKQADKTKRVLCSVVRRWREKGEEREKEKRKEKDEEDNDDDNDDDYEGKKEEE